MGNLAINSKRNPNQKWSSGCLFNLFCRYKFWMVVQQLSDNQPTSDSSNIFPFFLTHLTIWYSHGLALVFNLISIQSGFHVLAFHSYFWHNLAFHGLNVFGFLQKPMHSRPTTTPHPFWNPLIKYITLYLFKKIKNKKLFKL